MTPTMSQTARRLFSHYGDSIFVFSAWLISVALIALGKESPSLHPGELAYSANRGILAALILYVLFPLQFEKRRYWQFGFSILALFFIFGAIEEGVVEQYFFPYSRGMDGLSLRGVLIFFAQATPLVASLSAIKLLWNYNQAIRTVQDYRLEKASNELKFLKAQINPHVLFNSLNNIYAYVLEKKDIAGDMLLKLSDLLRYLLYECSSESVSLSKELDAIDNYIELQKMGLEGRGNVRLKVTGSPGGLAITPCILITIIENCFKHSMESLTDGIDIDIQLQIADNNLLTLTAKNNFMSSVGPSAVENRNGIGLSNIAQQLKLVHGDSAELTYSKTNENAHDTFTVNLTIPLVTPKAGHE